MKSNFTALEFALVGINFGSIFNVSLNKAGNIKVVNPSTADKEFWVLYKLKNGNLLWRRHGLCGSINGRYHYCYPLNMVGRKREGEIEKYIDKSTGKTYYLAYRPYEIKNSEFQTIEEAIEYFDNYIHRNNKI